MFRDFARLRFQPLPPLTWEKVNGTEVKIADIVSRRALLFHTALCARTRGDARLEAQLDGDQKHMNSPSDTVRSFIAAQASPSYAPPIPDPVLE